MNTSEQPPPSPASDSQAEPLQVGAGIDFSDPNSPLAPFYLCASHLIVVAFLALVFFFFGVATQLAHTDIWGHLKYGEWIVHHRALPDRELFSLFSDPDQVYWNFQWLSQVIFYLCYHAGDVLAGGDELHRTAGGVEMLRTLHGILITLKVGFLLLAIRRSTRSLSLAITGAVIYIVVGQGFNRIERPQVFGEVFFALLLWLVSGPLLARWCVVGIPLLVVVWANAHGSFLVGFVLLGAVCMGRIVEAAWRGRPGESWRQSTWLTYGVPALVISPLVVGFFNPHGWQLYSGIPQLARHPNIRTIAEWAPLDFSQPSGGHWTYLASLVALVLSQVISPRPLSLSRVCVLIPFALGPLYQQRMVVWWMLVWPWLLLELWRSAAAVTPRFWRGVHSVASFRKTLIAVLLILICITWSGVSQLLVGREPLPLEKSVTRATIWPLALQLKEGAGLPSLGEALKDYPNQRFQGRIFVQDLLADYLVWSLPEKAPVLVYNHAHIFPEAIWQDQITVLSGKSSWDVILERYQVNLIVFDPLMCPELAQRVRAEAAWLILRDDGLNRSGERGPNAFRGTLFIAIRKHPV
jgi:hypothetical protein